MSEVREKDGWEKHFLTSKNLHEFVDMDEQASWQIRHLLDPVILQEEFKFEAERAHSTVIEVKSQNAIPVTFPDVVVNVMKQAARAVAE